MKLNCSYLINTALSITVLTLTTLPANAKEVTNYAMNYNHEIHANEIAVPVTDTHKENHDTESVGKAVMSEPATEMIETEMIEMIEIKFPFAILVIVIVLGYFCMALLD